MAARREGDALRIPAASDADRNRAAALLELVGGEGEQIGLAGLDRRHETVDLRQQVLGEEAGGHQLGLGHLGVGGAGVDLALGRKACWMPISQPATAVAKRRW
jgi:hypothetical protein